jgi:Reverse transcriptase (RNA-dependent DNA polymerase)
VIEPQFERRFIFDSYANRVDKGAHRALNRCQQFARRHRYVLPCDIRQHFASIDHQILVGELGRNIEDAEVLQLCETILRSGGEVQADEYEMVYFPEDDLFAVNRPRGLPIGNLTSQFWSNCYLNPFDHFVKRELRCPAYLRFVDDFLLFADDRPTLRRYKSAVRERLAQLRLTLHQARAQVMPVTQGIPWLGFVVFPSHRRLKRRNVVNCRRRVDALVERYRNQGISFGELYASLRGWINHARHGDTLGLRKSVLRSVVLKRADRLP